MLYISFVILISAIFIFTLNITGKQLKFVILACMGIILLMISSILCSFRMSGVYGSAAFSNFRIIYKFAEYLKLSYGNIYKIALAGSFCIYCSVLSVSLSLMHFQKKTAAFLFLIPLYLYLFINDPDFLFGLYLLSAKEDISLYNGLIDLYNIVLTAVYFFLPIVCIFRYYTSTEFVIKKRNAILQFIYLTVSYLLIFMLNSVGLIHFLQRTNVLIVRHSDSAISRFATLAISCSGAVMILTIVFLTYKTSKFQKPSTSYIIKNTNLIDKNLRMILHTYKNSFFAINNKIKLLKTLDENYSDKAKEIIDSIEDFSLNELNEISDRINSLKNVNPLYKPVDLVKCADNATERLYIPEGISLIKDYQSGKAMLFSEEKSMTEMIFNLLQNSIEAFNVIQAEENSTIKIKIAAEYDWVLLEVTDNGCGISSKERKSIFTPLMSSKRGRDNFGIGLHYVKKTVEAHKGYIYLDSVKGSYTTFQIYLPTAIEEKNGRALKWKTVK